MKFSEALHATMTDGIGIYRLSWPGCDNHKRKGIPQFVSVRRGARLHPDAPHEVSPFLCIQNPTAGFLPWTPAQDDLFAEDWKTLFDVHEAEQETSASAA